MISRLRLVAGLGASAAASSTALGLHGGDLGILDAEAAAAEAEHRVEFVELVHAVLDLLDVDAELGGEGGPATPPCSGGTRAARRIEEADRGRETSAP